MDMDEIVDIINENNQVIGTTGKQEAHKVGALHRVIIAEVIDSQGNWTLVQQASDRQDAGQFVSPIGGHIQAGESEEAALAREAFEEMGFPEGSFTSKKVGEAIYYREVIGRKENHLFVVYEVFTDTVPVLNHESVGCEKFSQEELKSQIQQNPKKFGDAFHFVVKTFYPALLG
jgi:isopentenyl-diphosphate delta-isomerase